MIDIFGHDARELSVAQLDGLCDVHEFALLSSGEHPILHFLAFSFNLLSVSLVVLGVVRLFVGYLGARFG